MIDFEKLKIIDINYPAWSTHNKIYTCKIIRQRIFQLACEDSSSPSPPMSSPSSEDWIYSSHVWTCNRYLTMNQISLSNIPSQGEKLVDLTLSRPFQNRWKWSVDTHFPHVVDRDRSPLGHKRYQTAGSSDTPLKISCDWAWLVLVSVWATTMNSGLSVWENRCMHATVCLLCAGQHRPHGEISSVQRSILVGQIWPNGRERVNRNIFYSNKPAWLIFPDPVISVVWLCLFALNLNV